MNPIAFYIFGSLCVGTALLMVTRRNPISAALWLVVCFFAFAGLFILLGAHFIGAVQILLYAGAIMVLFIFVIMLLNLGNEELKSRLLRFPVLIGGAITIYLVSLIILGLLKGPQFEFGVVPEDYGFISNVGRLLFTRYLIPFELTSVLLLIAIVGSVVMSKRKL